MGRVAGAGNCDQVKEVVNQLSSGGSTTCFGIIDWDLVNNETGQVFVLGHQVRYSLENFLLDPLAIAFFLLRERFKSRDQVGFADSEKYTDIPLFDKNRLQNIVNDIESKVHAACGSPTISGRTSQSYVGGVEIEISNWYLRHQGHQLETALKSSFPELNRFRGEFDLKRKILQTIFTDHAEFIPKGIPDLLRRIQHA